MKAAFSTAALFFSLIAIAAPQVPQGGNTQVQAPNTDTGQPLNQVGNHQPQAPYDGPQPAPQTGSSPPSGNHQPQAPYTDSQSIPQTGSDPPQGNQQPQSPNTASQPVPQTGTNTPSGNHQPQAPPISADFNFVVRSRNIQFQRHDRDPKGVSSVASSSLLSLGNPQMRRSRAARRQYTSGNSRDLRSVKIFADSNGPGPIQGTAASSNPNTSEGTAASDSPMPYQGSNASDGSGSNGCATPAGSCSGAQFLCSCSNVWGCTEGSWGLVSDCAVQGLVCGTINAAPVCVVGKVK